MTTRRRLLRAAGVAGAGGLATLAGLRASSEGTRAAAALQITGDETTLGPDGAVEAVRLSVDVEWSHDLPPSAAPQTVAVTVSAGRADSDGLTEVADREASSLFPENSGTESVEADLLDAGALAPDALDPDAGGETSVEIEVVADVAVQDADGEPLVEATASDTATVTVTRETGGEASVGGEGALSVET
jgi:hypothetical protein